jgi:hypothetical protein
MAVQNGSTIDPSKIKLPPGFVLDTPAPSNSGGIDPSKIKLPPGFVLDTPASSAAAAPQPSFTENPDGEGTYAMWNASGKMQQVPYSQVGQAKTQNYVFDMNKGRTGLTPQQQYEKDAAYATRDAQPQSAWSGMKIGSPLAAVGNVVSHAANLVKGPFQALTAPPQNAGEAAVQASAQTAPGGAAIPLAAYRMFAEPTVSGVSDAMDLRKQGGERASLWGPSKYDAEGNNIPTAGSRLVDSIPIYGPWARNSENEARTQGALPAAAGLATDIFAPKLLAKGAGAVVQGAGNVARFAAATPEAQRVAATRMLVPGKAPDLLTRALKPSVTNEDFTGQVQRALPEIVKQNPQPGISGFADAQAAASGQEQAWYQSLLKGNRGIPVDFRPAVAAQVDSVPTIAALEDPPVFGKNGAVVSPGLVGRTMQTAENYLRPIGTTGPIKPTLGLADQLRIDSNQRLASLYDRAGGDQYNARANPEVARAAALADSLRDITYGRLARASGTPEADIRMRQNLYGDLEAVGRVAQKRATVFSRQNPMSLQESLAGNAGNPVTAAGSYLGQRLLKGVTNSDALVDAAIDRFKSEETPSLTPRQTLYGNVAGSVGNAVYSGGKAMAGVSARPTAPYVFGAAAATPPKKRSALLPPNWR